MPYSFRKAIDEKLTIAVFGRLLRMLSVGIMATMVGGYLLKDAFIKDMDTTLLAISAAMFLIGVFALWRCWCLIYSTFKA